jgi:hypothetical protein
MSTKKKTSKDSSKSLGTNEDDFDYLRCNPDFTSTLAWKISFVLSLVGCIVFFILFIFQIVKGSDSCLPGSQGILSCTKQTKYTVTWSFAWDKTNNGGDTPDIANFSVPIGVVSPAGVTPFWSLGSLATPGMQKLSEEGKTSDIEQEIELSGQTYFVSRASSKGVANISSSFIVEPNHRYLTTATKIAPSPDWFAGVSNLDLGDSEDNWLNHLSYTLMPISAGTDSGKNFDSVKQLRVPPIPIDFIKGNDLGRLFSYNSVGTISLTRVPLS